MQALVGDDVSTAGERVSLLFVPVERSGFSPWLVVGGVMFCSFSFSFSFWSPLVIRDCQDGGKADLDYHIRRN